MGFNSFGQVLPEYRKNLNGKGAVDLVNRIGAALREHNMLTFDVTPEEIFHALETDGELDGVYIYDVAKEVGKQWLSEKHKQNVSMIAGIHMVRLATSNANTVGLVVLVRLGLVSVVCTMGITYFCGHTLIGISGCGFSLNWVVWS